MRQHYLRISSVHATGTRAATCNVVPLRQRPGAADRKIRGETQVLAHTHRSARLRRPANRIAAAARCRSSTTAGYAGNQSISPSERRHVAHRRRFEGLSGIDKRVYASFSRRCAESQGAWHTCCFWKAQRWHMPPHSYPDAGACLRTGESPSFIPPPPPSEEGGLIPAGQKLPRVFLYATPRDATRRDHPLCRTPRSRAARPRATMHSVFGT